MSMRSSARRPRRRPGGSFHVSGSSISTSAVRLTMVTLMLCSVLYLISTHTALSTEGKASSWRQQVEQAQHPGQSLRPSSSEFNPYKNDDPRVVSLRNPDQPMDVPLQCKEGPPKVDLSYWKDIPRDKKYESVWGEFAKSSAADGNTQYVTFEPDHGGFNNIRMQMETVMVFAKATGRTLVMPLAQKFYLLKKPASEFADMFPVEIFSEFMDVLSTEEFLEKEGVTGRLGKLPPNKKASGYVKEDIEGYLREVAGFVPHWDHMSMALVFGPSPDNPDVPSDESSQKWLDEFLTEKRNQFFYTEKMQQARLIHFRTSGSGGMKAKANGQTPEYRLFTHFYTFIAFTDPVAARHHRRFIRDAVHFRESLFCVSARIVHRLRSIGHGDPGRWSGWHGEGGGMRGEGGWSPEEAASLGKGTRRAGFSTFHIRRGDFQYAKMKAEAPVIMEATKDIRVKGELLYIATDERQKEFFAPFEEEHRVLFLDDFKDLLEDVDPTYYLMIDTIVSSQGRAFIGTWRSTFTGYITRLRGYYNYPTDFSWYFYNEPKKMIGPASLAQETVPRQPFYMREWPTAWEDIDQDVEFEALQS